MKAEQWHEIDEILGAALELPAAERQPYVAAACHDDTELLAAVQQLLAADERAESFLERPATWEDAGPEEPAPIGLRFGPYRLERLLNRGGMGAVYLALRDDGQFERQVALKLLHAGGFSPAARERFRAERQILARLEHPGIARLYDGGETEQGLPFLVMEYVEGLPFDAYCDKNRLTLDERLEVFRKLLDAVAYAHQNLLVHRDIKPANVLVTAEGEPKLLDFGIATELTGGDPDAPSKTRHRAMTPGYASPEQVRGGPITTATDVYALGVVLYELLCGRNPYRLRSDHPRELEEAILEQHPERPSQALERVSPGAGVDRSVAEIATARRTRPPELRRRLHGDLDTIVGMALRKDPKRRYSSVGELAADLDRYRRGLPVSARPESVLYSAAKFVQRHRVGVSLATIALVLIVALLFSLFAQRNRAERERDKARQALAFLVDLFRHADPYQQGSQEVSARQLLATGAERVSQELAGDPEVQSALLQAIGQAEVGLGRLDDAAPLLDRALALRRERAPGSYELADSLGAVAWLEFLHGGFARSEALWREAIDLYRQLGTKEPALAFALNQLGNVLLERYQSTDAARSQEIEALHREALAIFLEKEGAHSLGAATSRFYVAKVLRTRGELPAAEALIREALQVDLELLGEDHPEVSMVRRALVLILMDLGRFDEASEILQQVAASQRKSLPPGHPDFVLTLNDLALIESRRGRYEAAEPLYREALRLQIAGFGETHAHTGIIMAGLAVALENEGKVDEAVRLQERALAIKRAAYGEEHLFVAQSLGALGRLRSMQHRDAEAIDFARRGLAIDRRILPAGHLEIAWGLRNLGLTLLAAGQPAEAEASLRQSLEILRQKQPDGYFQTARVEVLLGAALLRLGRTAEAAELLHHGQATLVAQLPASHWLLAEARGYLAELERAPSRQPPVSQAPVSQAPAAKPTT